MGYLSLEVELEQNLPLVSMDRDKVLQVLTNLLNNALKFTSEGSITIKARRLDQYIEVSVVDTGIGIKKEDVHHVFKSFTQVATECNRETGSSGLGLAISQKIVMQHHGMIKVESEYGKGSCFSFTLPDKELS